MAGTAENPKIGLDNVVIAPLLTDDGTNVPTYGSVIKLAGAVQASVNPNSSVETDYADNGAFFVTNNRANTEMTLELTNADPNTLAQMFGQTRANGITVEKPLDQSGYFALGFRVWIGGVDANGDKIFENFWYAKGKFSVPENGGTTKGESIDFQHLTLNAQFVPTQYKEDGNSGVICTHARTDIDTSSAVIAGWFNAPVLSTSVDTGDVTVTIAKGADAKTITITGDKDGAGDCVFAPSTANADNILVVADGLVVAGSFAVGTGENADVVTFTAAEAMSGDVVVTVTGGLKDINGVSATPTSAVVTIS